MGMNFQTRGFVAFVILIIFLSFSSSDAHQAHPENIQRVLILHSYDSTSTWTYNIQRGIQDVFPLTAENIELYSEYMDTKRYSQGKIVNPFVQGRQAALIGKKILAGTPPESIPIIHKTPTTIILNRRQMDRFGVLKSAVNQDALVLFDKKTFYEQYTVLVWASAIVLVLLLIFIILLWCDVLRRRLAEKKLKETQTSYLTLMQNLSGVVYRCKPDKDYTTLFISEGCESLTGYTVKEFIEGKIKFGQLIQYDYREEIWRKLNKAFEKKQPYELEYPIIRKDGEVRWVLEKGQGIFIENAIEPVFLEGFLTDISERKTAEQAIREKEIWFREIFDATSDAIFVHDKDTGKVIDVNKAGFQLLKYGSRENIINKELKDLPFAPPPYSAEDAVRWIRKTVTDGPQVTNWKSLAMDKTVMWSEGSTLYTNIAGTDYVLTILRDVTKKREAEMVLKEKEEQLRQSQKMDLIGHLAGGIAHDFNNMLGGIIGAAELLAMNTNQDDENHELIEMILNTAELAGDLTKKLLTFSRKATVLHVPVNMHKVIEDSIAILNRSIDKRIKLSKQLKAESSIVNGDASQLQNVILNLGVNARDAMPSGGELVVSTENVVLDLAYCDKSLYGLSPGSYIKIIVRDTGVGMSRETQKRIFEPFFTTKKFGKGTGLGLATVYGTIKELNGEISVNSEINKGTAFCLLIPLGKTRNHHKSETELPAPKGSGCILVIDDEKVIRNTARRILNAAGFDVLTANNGIEGVDVYSKNFAKIDLVLLDMIMPQMNGLDCFLEIKKINPAVKVIITSGFTPDLSINQMKEKGLSGFVKKPYRKNNIIKAVLTVLSQTPDSSEQSSDQFWIG